MFHVEQVYIQLVSWRCLGWNKHPTWTHQVIGAQNPTQDTQPNEVPKFWNEVSCLFHIHCVSNLLHEHKVPSSKQYCPINNLAANWRFLFNKVENVEAFCQSALGKHNPDQVLILAYVTGTRYPNWHGFSLLVPPLEIIRSTKHLNCCSYNFSQLN